MTDDLLADIRRFLAETEMGKSYFGKIACGNSELVDRLENGRTITIATADKVRDFMATERAKRRPEAAE